MIDIVDINVTALLPLLGEANRIQLPACVQKAVTNVVAAAREKFPPSVSALVEVIFEAQLTLWSNLDTQARRSESTSALASTLGRNSLLKKPLRS